MLITTKTIFFLFCFHVANLGSFVWFTYDGISKQTDQLCIWQYKHVFFNYYTVIYYDL